MSATPQHQPVVAAVYNHISNADDAVARLLEAGFTKEQITVVCSEKAVEEHFREFDHQDPAGTHTPARAAIGGAIGMAIGGLVTLGVATAGGAVILGAGALLSGAAGAVTGGLVGAMSARGIEKELADYYDQELTRGKILVAVEDTSDRRDQTIPLAEQIFIETGSEPVELPEG